MQEFHVKDHAPSLLPDGVKAKLVFADEFDGEVLNRDIWDYRSCMMGRRHPAWVEGGVTLDGKSHAVFRVMEKDGLIVSSQLQTGYNFMDEPVTATTFGRDQLQWPIGKLHVSKYLKAYGYFECRCRLQQMDGWWSAFWIQSPIIGASLDAAQTGAEMDIMESFFPGKVAAHNIFSGGYGKDTRRYRVGGRDDLDKTIFHTFGLLWDKNGYTFYIDGVEDGHISEDVSACPEFILISTEVMGYREKEHTFKPEAVAAAQAGDTFLVDHVRVFDVE